MATANRVAAAFGHGESWRQRGDVQIMNAGRANIWHVKRQPLAAKRKYLAAAARRRHLAVLGSAQHGCARRNGVRQPASRIGSLGGAWRLCARRQ